MRETAKTFCEIHAIPELNHNLLEGLSHLPTNHALKFVFLTSELYCRKNQQRMQITRKTLAKLRVPTVEIAMRGKTKLEQALWTLGFNGFASYYLAMLKKVNPAQIPWVDFFKNELSK
jgi:hypothetical protein